MQVQHQIAKGGVVHLPAALAQRSSFAVGIEAALSPYVALLELGGRGRIRHFKEWIHLVLRVGTVVLATVSIRAEH